MIRPPRPVRVGAAVLGVAGMLALAGCGASTDAADTGTTDAGTDSGTDASAGYADGTYTESGSYSTPESVETIEVTITLADSVITAVEVTGDPTKAESEEYQAKFISGIEAEVVGKDIDEISVSRVAGSSLTSGGFNQALESIKADALV